MAQACAALEGPGLLRDVVRRDLHLVRCLDTLVHAHTALTDCAQVPRAEHDRPGDGVARPARAA